MSRLTGRPWKVSSLLLYAGVAGCALLVASFVSMGLETNGSQPVLRAAIVDRSVPGPGALQIPTSSVVPAPAASTTAAPPATIAPAPVRSGGSGSPPKVGSSPAASPLPRDSPPAQRAAIQPQNVSPDTSVVEIPTTDASSQPSPTDSPSPSTDSPAPAKTGSGN
jgi:hypothetical protein